MAQRTILIQSKAHLCIKNGLLMINVDDRSSTIPLEDIWVVIVESHQTAMTVACMSQLNDAGIGVMICGRDHMPNGLMLPMGAHSRHARIVEDQLAMSLPFKKQLWKRSVQASEEQPLAVDGSYPRGFTITAFTTRLILSTILLNRSAPSST